MDGICSAVLNKIYALGAPGRYFVISSDEFFEALPEDCARDEGQLKIALKSLATEGYIDIKYSSGNMYCVALLKVFTDEDELSHDDGFEDCYEPEQTQKTAYRSAFWGALFGSALGSGIVGAIALIIGLAVL